MEANEPKSLDVVIIPVAFKQNNELGQCLDKAREAKTIVAEVGLSCWTDMRRQLTPSAKYQYWEEKGVPIRIEIGQTEIRDGTVVVADLVNKTRHAKGRMIATRKSVRLDELADVVKAIAEDAKQQGSRKRRKGGEAEGSAKWMAVLDLIDKGGDASTAVEAAAAEAAAAVPPAPKKAKGAKSAGKGAAAAGGKAARAKGSDADGETNAQGRSDSGAADAGARGAEAEANADSSHKKKKRRKKSKKKSAAASDAAASE